MGVRRVAASPEEPRDDAESQLGHGEGLRTPSALIAFALLGTAHSAIADQVCSPVAIAHDQAPLDLPWENALDDLIAATAHETAPWGCPGGEISLVLERGPEAGALLTFVDPSGRRAER